MIERSSTGTPQSLQLAQPTNSHKTHRSNKLRFNSANLVKILIVKTVSCMWFNMQIAVSSLFPASLSLILILSLSTHPLNFPPPDRSDGVHQSHSQHQHQHHHHQTRCSLCSLPPRALTTAAAAGDRARAGPGRVSLPAAIAGAGAGRVLVGGGLGAGAEAGSAAWAGGDFLRDCGSVG